MAVMKLGNIGAIGGASLVALSLLLTPVVAATPRQNHASSAPSVTRAIGFTPAVSDPRLAAELARRGYTTLNFRFTPAAPSANSDNAVRVAVRARPTNKPAAARTVTQASATPVTAITPASYNLGVAVGWKRFALSGDVAKTEGGDLPGTRESAELGVSYAATKRITGRVEIEAERAEGPQALIGPDSSYALDVGGSYRLTRNLHVTGGVRYKIENERLQPLADERRDSQAVYIGTAFRF
jgi:hypothetical protein